MSQPQYTIAVAPPRWYRFEPLAWLARVTKLDRRWAAHGDDVDSLRASLDDLSRRKGFNVAERIQADTDSLAEWMLSFPGDQSVSVSLRVRDR